MKTKIYQTSLLSLGVMFVLAITAHAQNLFVSVSPPASSGLPGSIFEYTPAGAQTTVASGLSFPRGIAFDASGDLFVAVAYEHPDSEHARILELLPLGTQSVLGNVVPSFIEGVVTDGAGNVFVAARDDRNETSPGIFVFHIYKFAPNGTRSMFGSTPGTTFGLAFDSAGNLYAADADDATIYKFTPNGTRSVFVAPGAFTSSQGPAGLAFDSTGNLFVATEGNPGNDAILEFTPTGMESTFATGLTNPRGLAFDRSGNLFVAESVAVNGDILKFAPGGGAPTVFASGINRPEFLTFGPPR